MKQAIRRSAAGDDDAQLVLSARRGSREAFAVLVKRYQGLACSVAYALTGSFSHSEEIAQEVFIAAWRQLGQCDPPAAFRRWIYGITRRKSGRYRSRERDLPDERGVTLLGAGGIPSGEPSPLDRVVR